MGVMVVGFLLAVTPPPTTLLPSSPAPSVAARSFASQPFPRLANNSFGINPKSTVVVKERYALIAKASSEEVSSGLDGSVPPPADSEKENVSVENLPLESKAQLLLEQKLRMKLAKKIRLRRKRLVRKRHLRKKGRWPPSKMKKNKNV